MNGCALHCHGLELCGLLGLCNNAESPVKFVLDAVLGDTRESLCQRWKPTSFPHQVYQLLTIGREQPWNGVTKPNRFPSLGSHPESRNGKGSHEGWRLQKKNPVQGQRNEGCWINLRFKITWCGGMTGWPSVYIELGKASFSESWTPCLNYGDGNLQSGTDGSLLLDF